MWAGILGLGLLGGLYTVVQLFLKGHSLLSANDTIIWTLPIVSYVFFALISTGIALVATFPVIFNQQEFEPMEKRLTFLAIATLISAFVSIGIELGSVGNMLSILLSPNPTSPIWWMATLYTIELVLLIMKYSYLSKGKNTGKGLAITSAIICVMAVMVLGFVFGGAESRPSYFGPFMSIYTLVMALLSGCAAILAYDGVKSICSDTQRVSMGKTFAIILSVGILVVLLRAVLAASHTNILAGNSGWFAILLMLALVIGISSSSRVGKAWAGITALVGVLLIHTNIIIGGQIHPIGPKAEGMPATLSYSPNIWEILIFLFSLSLALSLYTWGEKKLSLE